MAKPKPVPTSFRLLPLSTLKKRLLESFLPIILPINKKDASEKRACHLLLVKQLTKGIKFIVAAKTISFR